MNDLKDIFKKFKNIKDKKLVIILALGFVGILLIMISSFTDGNEKKNYSSTKNLSAVTEEYSRNLEKGIENIVSDMLGGADVQVMVTLENSAEYVYATEYKTDNELTDDKDSQKLQQNDRDQKNYVIITDKDGNESALVVYTKMPIIKGVVVVCDSGQSQTVAAAVRLAVKSALNIDDDKICIIGRYK